MRVTSGVAGTIFATMLVAALLLVFQADAIAAPPPDLTVGEGQTVTIGPGPLEYGEVTIATGGLLQFTGSVSLTCLRLVLRGVIQIGGDASILCTHQESEPEATGPAVLFDAGIIRSDTSALHPTATNGANGAAATIPGGSGQDGGSRGGRRFRLPPEPDSPWRHPFQGRKQNRRARPAWRFRRSWGRRLPRGGRRMFPRR